MVEQRGETREEMAGDANRADMDPAAAGAGPASTTSPVTLSANGNVQLTSTRGPGTVSDWASGPAGKRITTTCDHKHKHPGRADVLNLRPYFSGVVRVSKNGTSDSSKPVRLAFCRLPCEDFAIHDSKAIIDYQPYPEFISQK